MLNGATRAVVGLGAVGVIGMFVWDLAVGEPAPATPNVVVSQPQEFERSDSTALSRDMNELRRQVSELTRAVANMQTQGAVPSIEPKNQGEKAREEQSREADAAAHAAARAEAMERLQTIDNSFIAENRDDGWAFEMEERLDEVFQSGGFEGTQIVSSACKLSFCRIEVEHEGQDAQNGFEDFRRSVPGNFYMQRLENGEEPPRTVAFFVREGFEKNNVLHDMMYSEGDG